MTHRYKTHGVCASHIDFEIIDNKIHNVSFNGGCTGNSRAVAALIEGMPVDEAIKKLQGIQCRNGTSCADQLSRALIVAIKQSQSV